MKYIVDINESNYVRCLIEDVNGIIELDLSTIDLTYLSAYKLIDGELVLDEVKLAELKAEEDKRTKAEQIAELKQELAKTDYEAIKYSEGWFTDEEYGPIKTMRESLREQIRALESNI